MIRRWLTPALLLLTLSCAGTGDPSVPATVRALMTHDLSSLTLIGKADVNSERLAVQVTDSLVQYDAEMTLRPRVAESWEYSDDNRTITFHLREGVRWHDGRPVTAADVVFSVQQARDPKVEAPTLAEPFVDLEEVVALDERTVRATYTKALPDAIEGWRLPLIPSHLAESGADLLTGEFSRHPVGCGPFRFVRYRPGEDVVLEANDDYWDGRPAINRLVFLIVPDQRTAMQLLLAGDMEIMTATSDVYKEAMRSPRAERLDSFVYERLSVWHVKWNHRSRFFGDARVRRAMVQALDRQEFVDKMIDGLGRVAATTYHPDLPSAEPSVTPWPYDPVEAGRLLDEAGWRDTDGDGVRERDGRPFRFTLMVAVSTQKLAEHSALWMQQSLAAVGVRMEIESFEWSHYREQRKAGLFDAALGSVSSTIAPDQWALYHTKAQEQGINYGGFSDARVDELLDLGRETFDRVERQRIYSDLQRRLHELEPIGCLFNFSSPVLHDRRLTGVRQTPLDYYRTSEGPRVWRWKATREES